MEKWHDLVSVWQIDAREGVCVCLQKDNEETIAVIQRRESKSYLGNVSKASYQNDVKAEPWMMTKHLLGRNVRSISMCVNQKWLWMTS